MSVSSGVKTVGGSDQTHASKCSHCCSPFIFLLSSACLVFSSLTFSILFCHVWLRPLLYLFISLGLSLSLSLALLSITLFSPYPFPSCGWWMLMNLWMSAWGGLSSERDQKWFHSLLCRIWAHGGTVWELKPPDNCFVLVHSLPQREWPTWHRA